MKSKSFLSQGLPIFIIVLILGAISVCAQEKVKVPEAEAKAAKAVESAPDIDAKMTAAEEFLKKYPKSNARSEVAQYVVSQILGVSDPNQKLALAQKYTTIFTAKNEADSIKPSEIDAYTKLGRFDEAFAEAATYIAKQPEDIQVLVLLSITGVEQAKAKNPKFVAASKQYGAKAIEMLEGDKKPVTMDADVWARQKAMLPQIYQELAIVSLMEQNPTEARAKLEKASQLNPVDPFNHMLLGSIVNDEYQKLALAYKSMTDTKTRDETMVKINALLDKIIEHYARGVALAEGKPQYQQFHDQLLQDLSSYYSFRHNHSTEGLQQLINSYKAP